MPTAMKMKQTRLADLEDARAWVYKESYDIMGGMVNEFIVSWLDQSRILGIAPRKKREYSPRGERGRVRPSLVQSIQRRAHAAGAQRAHTFFISFEFRRLVIQA